MSILFIGSELTKKNSGGAAVSKRNFDILSNLYPGKIEAIFLSNNDIKNLDKSIEVEIRSRNKIKRVLEFLLLYAGGLNRNIEKKILNKLETKKYEIIFLDLSLYGRLAKIIKKMYKDIKIITFFHNVEKDYILSMSKVAGKKFFLVYPSYIYNESLAIKYSDILIALNERDSSRIKEIYKTSKEVQVLPVSFQDEYKRKDVINICEKKIILFVGSLFFANIQGINWFLNEIYPKLNNNFLLRIVGKDMELKRKELEKENVEVVGTVEDLQNEYEKADFVIAPILTGSGMKVKTAEALKFGKKIFGTEEAFQGYEIDAVMSCIRCDNEKEFIEKINKELKNKNTKKYYEESRRLFMQKYSYSSSQEKLKRILKNDKF